ncbi:glutathione peroxidase [Mucilaginibacter jinjuensis]|uniref:Glutathione peroxidase n=1 Tax=Mucilaginibacter jinjuensis TaxID=1176721 RepID=A0ABY7TC15_9SPHI|nr:glutathione peroxidase [Mucilaginibacter jinjuensis]WCT13981.1 glutathione peroxidase [Mucilaginibacter jinjuensis]
MDNSNIYQFSVKQLNGEEVSLDRYQNKVLLIVNTASQCGFTPQLADLVELKKSLLGKDFEILAFPSNDFGGQEPLEGEAIATFCERFDTNFPLFDKIRVRGTYADPLYQFLSTKKQNGRVNAAPRWNFHKYLVDKNGKVVDFFYPFTKPGASKIKKKIAHLLAQ